MVKKFIFGLIVFLGTVFVCAAENEDETVARAKYDVEIKKLAAEMNSSCGTSIEAKIDWDSFSGSEWNDYSVPSFCGEPLEELTDFCSAEKGNSKAYIRKRVKSVTCLYGGEGKRELQIDNGDIKNIVDFKASNLKKFIHAALIKDL